MTVKEVLALAAELLGRQDLKTKVESSSSTPADEVAELLRCYNLVENEVALDYFPLKRTEQFQVQGGKLAYTAFSVLPVDVHKVISDGRSVNFSVFPEYLKVEDCTTAEVTYSYAPPAKTITGSSEFSERVSARLLAYGVAAEFCLLKRKYEESKMWALRYRDALRAAGILRRSLSVRSRRWV